MPLRRISRDDPQPVQPCRLAHGVDGIKPSFALQGSDGRRQLQCFGRGQVGDRRAEQDSGKQFILRQCRHTVETDVGLQAGSSDMDRRAEVADIRLGVDIQRGIDGSLAVELDPAFAQVEPAAGKFIAAAHQFRPPGNGRVGHGPADIEVRAPFTVEPQARHHQPIARAGMHRQGPGHAGAWPLDLVPAPVDFHHAQFGDLRHRRGAAHGEAAAVQDQVAADRAARAVGFERQGPRHRGSDVIPLQQCGIVRLKHQIHAHAGDTVEGKAPAARDGPAILRAGGKIVDDQLRTRKAPLRFDAAQTHTGHGAVDRCVVSRQLSADLRIGKRAAHIRRHADWPANIHDFHARQPPERVGCPCIAQLCKERRRVEA